ncbi:MAG: UPF0149 family protein [Thiohalorhabdaceae bacterium]
MHRPDDSPQALAALAAYLEAPERSEGTLSYHGLQGYFFALATSPEPIAMGDWLPAVFGDTTVAAPEEEAEDGRERAIAGLFGLFNRINDEVAEGRIGLPADLEVFADPLANVGPEAPLGQWSAGFSRGMGLIEGVWDECSPWAPEDMAPWFAYWVVELSLFAEWEYGAGLLQALEPDSGPFEDWVGPVLARFEENMAALADVGRRTALALEEFDAAEGEMGHGEPLAPTQPIRREKIGRNEPCPCGSGKKYKKCCLRG